MTKFLQVLFMMIIYTSSIIAQTGNIQGKITDDLGLIMPGATIFINTTEPKGTITDNAGKFNFSSIPTGNYTLSVSYLGYENKSMEVAVETGKTTTITIAISEASILGDEVIILGDRLRGQAKALNQQKNNANITNIVAENYYDVA
jgi:hypothetical protein